MDSHRETLELIKRRDRAGEISRQRTIAILYDEIAAVIAENEAMQARVNHLEERLRQTLAIIGRRDAPG